ncbi:MAG TPA: DUF3048 domain-containing protein, partial [Streptosporangiaceae bacterium]|nr:DUF3048 domain-containing protein [Streptosporangiaceae bacterium]
MWSRNKIIAAVSGGAGAAGLTATLVLALTASPHVAKVKMVDRPTPTPTPTRSPSRTSTQLYSPFTGEPVSRLKPVLAVKIDNIVLARPQTGINSADLVYVIPVEGGLSRFMAVFSSHDPRVIGPVRSTREDDIALLRQFGRPAFAFSGAQPHLLPVVEHSRIVDLYANKPGIAGYYRDSSRIAPYNLFARASTLVAEARHASIARNIGFTFGPLPPGGRSVRSKSVSYSAASFTFTWSPGKHRWLVWMDGARAMTTDAGQMSAATVVIQYTRVISSRFREWGNIPPPYAVSVGSGNALVLRDGKA